MSDAGEIKVGEIIIRLEADMEAIVPKYLVNRKKDCDAIRQFAAAGTFAEAKRLGHNMKGTGGGYGFEEISRLGAEIEHSAAAGNAAQLVALAAELEIYLSRVRPIYE